MIILSTLIFTIEDPLDPPDSMKNHILRIIDIVVTCVFIIEVTLKCVAYGILYNGQESFLRNVFNIIDTLIIILSVISFVHSSMDLSFFKVMRICRVLRPIRLISKNNVLKTSIKALLEVIPNIINVLFISVFMLFIFSIMAVSFMKGLFYTCDT